VISGGHITLRPWERSDIAFIYDSWQDAEMQRWTHVHPYTALDAATFIELHARPQPEQDGAFFAIIRTDTGEVLGSISFDHIDWDLGVADVGYWVSLEARGDGVATGALEALVAWGQRELRLVEVRLHVASKNLVSQRVAERAGFARADADSDEMVAYVRSLVP
jgi:RimJ/RimL family protein N-acetyltransferase